MLLNFLHVRDYMINEILSRSVSKSSKIMLSVSGWKLSKGQQRRAIMVHNLRELERIGARTYEGAGQ